MMSELRDRIAAAITRADVQPSTDSDPYVEMAEAVITELGLRIERGERSKPDGILWARNNRYTVHRYVTEWKADDE